jgi:O-antigen/teichoic acid export membrane protein
VLQVLGLTLVNAAVVLGYTFISGAPILVAACISLIVLPAVLCLDYGIAFLLGSRRHTAVSVIRVISSVVYTCGLIVLYVLRDHSLETVVAILAGSAMFAGIVSLQTGVRAIRSADAPDSIVKQLGLDGARKKVLAFGRHGYVGYLAPVDSFRIDQLVVGFLISPRALGLYVVGSAFTNFARMISVNVGLSATPEIASHKDPLAMQRAVQRTLLLAAGIMTIVTACLGPLVIVAIPLLFGQSYRSSIPVAEILFVAGWLLAMKRIAVDAMRGAGESQVGTKAEIINLMLFLLACGPLGLWLGGPGVALALVLASAGGSVVLIRKLHQLGILGGRRA